MQKKSFLVQTIMALTILFSLTSGLPARVMAQDGGAQSTVLLPMITGNRTAGAASSAATAAGAAQTYLVLYKASAVPADAAAGIAAAGGTLVYSYSQIGVALARSADPSFGAKMLTDKRVQGAPTTANLAVQLRNATDSATHQLPMPQSQIAIRFLGCNGIWCRFTRPRRTPSLAAVLRWSSAILTRVWTTPIPDLAAKCG